MTPEASTADLYLDLLAKTLTRALFEEADHVLGVSPLMSRPRLSATIDRVAAVLGKAGIEVALKRPYDRAVREAGRDWPARAETMAGLKRLANARLCIESVVADGVEGDIVETGVWRGGMSIYMRAVLRTLGVTDRKVWLADSFRGLPAPDSVLYKADAGIDFSGFRILSVGVEQVRRNFQRYGLLDDQVEFLPGWFGSVTLR